MKSAAGFLTALALLSGCQIPEKMPGPSPGLPQEIQGGPQSFTETTMNHFLSMTAPPQGISNPPQGMTTASTTLTSPPQGVTSPPQGMTAPSPGSATALERAQFNRFDSNGDGFWDKAELATYIQAWDSLNQGNTSGFGTKSLAVGLSLDPAGLMDTYDRNHDRLLDFEEARLMFEGLRQTLIQTVNQVSATQLPRIS
ncbi:MAG TPA: EF-hand domain-containing protein [Candidatus Obscuribacterales bacterium]